MRLLVLLVALAPAWAQVPLKPAIVPSTEKPSAMNQVITDQEKRLDDKLNSTGGNDPIYMLGLTRGLYLQGYGAVFTAEVSLINTPVASPFRKITKDDVVKVHQRKLERLGLLKTALREQWISMAAALNALPDTEQIVIAVRLRYLPYEDTTGLPGQIIMKGPRTATLTGAIQTEEQ